MEMHALSHYGILGMRWGVRKEERRVRNLNRKDAKWARTEAKKIADKAKSQVASEAAAYAKSATGSKAKTSRGQISKTYMNEYNQRLALLMNERVSDLKAPSGRVVRFLAKRGELGVHMALADVGYDMTQVQNGVNSAGKIAYRKQTIDKV